jgi:hypothetical protein
MDVNLSTDLRIEVTKWINSKNKNFDAGLDLLQRTGYKPHVCHNFIENKRRSDVPLKLENQLRLYLRYYANPKNPIHQDETSNFYQKNVTPPENNQVIFQEKGNFDLYPAQIKDCLTEFRDLYVERSKLHNQLKASGEENSNTQIKNRKVIIAKIEASSARMDELHKRVDDFKKYGYLPSDEFVSNKLDLSKVKPKEEEETPSEKKFELGKTLKELTKQSDNWRTKLVKAKNRLKYQSDTKQEKENPMPDGPKKIILERRIERLTKEKLIIDISLANLK